MNTPDRLLTNAPADSTAVLDRYYRGHARLYDATRWSFLFGRTALIRDLARLSPPPRNILEIGCGMGDTTAEIAAAHPETDYLGIEVHTPGIGNLCKHIAERGLTNLRLCQHDAVEVVRDMLPEASLDGIHIFFPDPWHKKRHHKRRLIQGPFVTLLASRLKPGGYLHCATDWEEYAVQMVAVLTAEPALANTAHLPGGFAPRPDYRPVTRFEHRGLKLGHGVWDVVFRKR